MLATQTSEEKKTLLDRLRESERRFIAAAGGVPDRCAKVSPAEGNWSVLDVVEHITLADRRMWKRYLDAGPNPGSIHLPTDEFIEQTGRDRSARRQAPEHVQPAGQFGSLGEGLSHYRSTRSEIAAFIENSKDNFRQKRVQHPMGEMDGHQLFLLIAAHSERHAMQIEEIKNSAAYQTAGNQKAAN